jgi:hypothetical protein
MGGSVCLDTDIGNGTNFKINIKTKCRYIPLNISEDSDESRKSSVNFDILGLGESAPNSINNIQH